MPLINWKTLPSLNSARWNSRGIYALIAYFILPKWRDTLNSCCQFISNTWADKWFSSQFFNPEDLYDLTEAIYVTKAKNSLNTIDNRSWNKDPSRIEVPRTNIVAERAIQKMDKIIQSSNTLARQKFINSNLFTATSIQKASKT